MNTEITNKPILFISDLDGTLLGSDSRLSAASVGLLNEAIRSGALFSIATARTPATVSSLLSEVRTNLPFVVMTGSTLWNPANREYSHTRFLPESQARQVLDIYRTLGFSSFIYTLRNGMLHIYHTGPLSEQERRFMAERADSPFKTFHVPPSGESVLPPDLDNVMLFYGIRETEISRRVYQEVKNTVDCSPLCYHDIYGPDIAVAEVFAADATKAQGIKTLAEMTGAVETIVFGDNINDLPMFRQADISVAVENAVPEVRQAADIVIGPNTSDAVPRFILDRILHRY